MPFEVATTAQRTRRVLDERIELAVGLGALGILVLGCFLVLRPFITSLLWAVILVHSTWPVFEWLRDRLRGRRTLAASVMTAGLTLALVLPLVLVGSSAADGINVILTTVRTELADGLPPAPGWVASTPLVGTGAADLWNRIAEGYVSWWQIIQPYFSSVSDVLLGLGVSIGGGLIELSMSVTVAFFLYRDGDTVAASARTVMRRIFGDRAPHLIHVAGSTTKGVVYGLVGTALIQGVLSAIGFLVIGLPSAVMLGFFCFVLAVLPLGPPFIWVPVTVWLFANGEIGWGIFMLLWGGLVVSGSDNFIRPWLISRGSSLSFLPVFLGVLGGALAFGFLGIFVGPVLLALGAAVLGSWAANVASPSDEPEGDEPLPSEENERITLAAPAVLPQG